MSEVMVLLHAHKAHGAMPVLVLVVVTSATKNFPPAMPLGITHTNIFFFLYSVCYFHFKANLTPAIGSIKYN